MKRELVVVGHGMVAHRFCERLVDLDRERRFRITVLGEEPRPAYDRVHLTDYLAHRSERDLTLASKDWYAAHDIDLRLGEKVLAVDRAACEVHTAAGPLRWDTLVLATGSAPFVPPVPGMDRPGVFVYRTIEDLEAILAWCDRARRVAVIGGGLLGLEAARAMVDRGLETHVIEVAPRLMPRQLDDAAAGLLLSSIRRLGVHVHLGARIAAIAGEGAVSRIDLDGAAGSIDVEMVVVSAGIRARDELARGAGLAVGECGGVVVDDLLRTTDERIFAIGEVALHEGRTYGLVAPGYQMAEALAKRLTGDDARFTGSDQSARLKLLGTDVASFGDPFAPPPSAKTIVYEDQIRGIYKKLVLDDEGTRLVGGILVGDAGDYGRLVGLARSSTKVSADDLFASGAAKHDTAEDAQVCSCNGVTAGAIRACMRDGGITTVAEVKACTRAGTGCGGCMPMVADIVVAELARAGEPVKRALCEHFAFTRQELFEIVAATRVRTFAELVAKHGQGAGCEICKPTVASILASIHAEPILDRPHRTLQDSNDRYLANIQKNGLYSVVPRIPAGEVTPEQLVVLGRVAKKYGLYTKITGGQRIDLFGAHLEQLPAIWEELVAAGFESGHAYGKAMRTVKSCVGSTWCRYGVQDSTAFAIRIENRYKGIRAPHKLKSAVSGCVRECAEAKSKDFGLIATERGWNVWVCGNGGASPRHADLLVSDVDEDTAIRYLDRFIMFYIRTADRLTRTSAWLAQMDGGIERLRDVIVNDSLGIAADLERDMDALVANYRCEWADVVGDPEKRAGFRPPPRRLPVISRSFVRLADVADVPADGGVAVKYGDAQIAIFHLASRDEWYAIDDTCPHTRAAVLSRGIVGDERGAPKVACPLHKKTFDLRTGECTSGDALSVSTYAVRIEGDGVFVELPPVSEMPVAAPCKRAS